MAVLNQSAQILHWNCWRVMHGMSQCNVAISDDCSFWSLLPFSRSKKEQSRHILKEAIAAAVVSQLAWTEQTKHTARKVSRLRMMLGQNIVFPQPSRTATPLVRFDNYIIIIIFISSPYKYKQFQKWISSLSSSIFFGLTTSTQHSFGNDTRKDLVHLLWGCSIHRSDVVVLYAIFTVIL